MKERFWCQGEIEKTDSHVWLRQPQENDKGKFIRLQKENRISKELMESESVQNQIWKMHTGDSSLMFSIEVDGEYAGYSGVNDLTAEKWEISIELLREFHNSGVGYAAVGSMLSVVKERLGVSNFRARISPDNYACQHLAEKLGLTPNGICEYVRHSENCGRGENGVQDECKIDEKMKAVAQKFGVEPEKLLTHVLEYDLNW